MESVRKAGRSSPPDASNVEQALKVEQRAVSVHIGDFIWQAAFWFILSEFGK